MVVSVCNVRGYYVLTIHTLILYKPIINVEKEYKKAPVHIIDKYNKEDKAVASELGLLDRMIFKTRLQKAFYTFKDHK